ncbi:hypothetical protein LJR034_001910 [Caballeronia sp. LjRoot34]|uniref:hypothetical protein n=1 Tax=Caballeronia sp. LjRoot34 TaxID=3342325 RepID=UPI003ECDA4A7
MVLSPLPLAAHPISIADWIEFSVLCSEFDLASIVQLQRYWDVQRVGEDEDFEGDSHTQEEFLEQILSEVRNRVHALGPSYPFELSESGDSLSLRADVDEAGYIYLFCLLLSHFRRGEILSGVYLPPINGRVRDLFQVCSTLAAAGVVEGCAVSFGFPRPDHSGFLVKLREVYERFGEGRVVDAIPAGASVSPKDEEIDIIAWSPRRDFAAGKYYVLAQVASGEDWVDKSVRSAVLWFHDIWFSNPRPASTATPAMFVPFCIRPTSAGESMKERLHILTHKYGDFYYRYMIPPLAARGLELARTGNENILIERSDDVPALIDWVQAQVGEMKRLSLNAA